MRKCHPQDDPAGQTAPDGPVSSDLMGTETGNLQPLSSSQVNPESAVQPQLQQSQAPVSDLFLSQNISWLFRLPQFITAFFDRFHPSFPAIHRPTFDVTAAKEPLLQAVACIGALYQAPGCNHSISSALFDAGHKSLDKYVCLSWPS